MKYCINYSDPSLEKLFSKVDEITITYRPTDETLIDFLKKYSDKRINIYIDQEKDFIDNNRIKFFIALAQEQPAITNYVFKLKNYKRDLTKQIYTQLKENNFKYFFETFVSSWDTFMGYLTFSPTDIYIVEELGFDIKKCANVAHSRGTALRVFPNIAQSSWEDTNALMKFFIRPEDTHVYEPFVDVYEFMGEPDRLHTYLKIYQEDQKWFGNLQEMILSFQQPVDSRCILPDFAEHRLECGKKCLKGNPCTICANIYKLADILAQNNLTLRKLTSKKLDLLNKKN